MLTHWKISAALMKQSMWVHDKSYCEKRSIENKTYLMKMIMYMNVVSHEHVYVASIVPGVISQIITVCVCVCVCACACVITDLLPALGGEEMTRKFLQEVFNVLWTYICKSNQRNSKVLSCFYEQYKY